MQRSPRQTVLGRALATLLVLLAALTTSVGAQQLDVKEIVLENGMKVLLYRRPGDPNVAAGWIAHVGSVNEKPGITGLSHLFEHMMFKGTHKIGTTDIKADLKLNDDQDRLRAEIRKEQAILDENERLGLIADAQDPAARSARHADLLKQFDGLLAEQKKILVDNEFDKIYTGIGGASGMNAGTSEDFTVYFVNVPSNKLELWFWMEADRLGSPVFRQFYSERDVVWEERRMRTDSTPTGKLDEQFEAMYWMGSTYAWPVIGWPSDLNGITREEANAYFEANYSPSNITAALVGDFDPREAEVLARRYFGPLKRSPNPPAEVRTYSPAQAGVRRFDAEAESQPQVKVRWPGVQYGHVDQPALSVLADLLNGETGRLELSLVKGQKLASSASASAETKKHGGYVEIRGVAATDHQPADVEQAIYREVARLKDEPVPDRELQKIKNQALATKYRRLDGNFTIMIQLLIYDTYDDWRDMETETTKYLAVTAADVQRVAQKYLKDEVRNIAVYRTKPKPAGEDVPAKSPDELFAALGEPLQQYANQMKEQLGAAGPEELAKALGEMGAMRSQAPPPMAPLFDWAEAFIQSRIAAAKGGQQ